MTARITSEILDRLPPSDLNAERCVLGSIILNPAVLDDLTTLRPEHFYAECNARLYRHLLTMRDEAVGIDLVTIVGRLRAAGELEVIGGPAYLAEVAQSIPVAAHAAYYAGFVKRHAMAREIIHASTETLRNAWDPTMSPTETLDAAEASLAAIETGLHTGDPVMVSEVIPESLARVDAQRERKQSAGVLTGLWGFDNNVGGLFGGELIILAARPGLGKTALASQIAHQAATRRGLVYLASLEMSRLELTDRMICTLGGISSVKIRTGDVQDSDYRLLMHGAEQLGRARLAIHDRPRLTTSDIRRSCRRLMKQGLCLAVVDYLQLITPTDRRLQRFEQIGQMTKDLKQIARELNIPVLCLCQLNRESEKEKRRPRMSDLRGSGEIEQDSDVVMFLHREQGETATIWDIAKCRNGQPGALRLEWEGRLTLFRDAQPENHEPAFDDFGA